MPHPPLAEPEATLERQIIETMQARRGPGESVDWEGCVRAILIMFKVDRRPLPATLYTPCESCLGTGYMILSENRRETCVRCKRGKIAL